MQKPLIDKWSYIFATFLMLFSFIIVFSNTWEFFGSLTASILTASLGWASYVIVRLTYLSLKK